MQTTVRSDSQPYAAPHLVDHGDAVVATQGTCACKVETSGFKSILPGDF